MNSFEQIKEHFFSYIHHTHHIPLETIRTTRFDLNSDESKQQFGDISSNLPLLCAKHTGVQPRIFAQGITQNYQHPLVEKIELAGPGFLNFYMRDTWFTHLFQEIMSNPVHFFQAGYPHHEKINVEFVSANPTGPLHIGHGRNGIIGDVLASLYQFLQQPTSREFYINDAGAQITKLGLSLKIRCLQLLGQDIALPEDAYHGDYMKKAAEQCIADHGTSVADKDARFFELYAQKCMLSLQQKTLADYGIHFDTWFSEKSLHDSGQVAQSLEALIQSGYTYEQDGALWFRSTTFGDDKDRVLKKANGELTYVAADVAYLLNKMNRGFTKLVMVLGHDHHSYKTRLRAIMQALGHNPDKLDIILYQLVHVLQDGQPVKMSKRTGSMITLSDIIDEVGKNVARFFFLNRKSDAELEFDLTLALSQSNENPIFYIQYAYVRTHSIQAKAQEEGIFVVSHEHTYTFEQAERLILKKICGLKELLFDITNNNHIHLIAYYAYELATLFHKYYNMHRIVDAADPKTTAQRIQFITCIQRIFEVLFTIMGITPLLKM